jgi:hypothetical protein
MEPFSTFKSFLLILQVEQRRQKQPPESETRHPGWHTFYVEDRKASGPWQHPSFCGRPARQRQYSNSTCWNEGLARTKVVPWGQKWVCMLPEGSPRWAHRVRPIPAAPATVAGLGRTGKMKMKRYLGVSWDINEITRLEIRNLQICMGDLQGISSGYQRISQDIMAGGISLLISVGPFGISQRETNEILWDMSGYCKDIYWISVLKM